MPGFIKNLFGGIVSFISGIFGKKAKKVTDKESKELTDKESKKVTDKESKKVTDKKSKEVTSTAPKAKKAKGYYLELDDTGNVKTEDKQKKPEPVKAAVAEGKSSKAKSTAKKPEPAKTEVQSKNGKVKIDAQPNPPAPALAASNGKVDPQSEKTFAPNYLLSTASTGRRRPGPSMDAFRDMARQVKTRR